MNKQSLWLSKLNKSFESRGLLHALGKGKSSGFDFHDGVMSKPCARIKNKAWRFIEARNPNPQGVWA